METSSGVAPAERLVATAEIPGFFQQDPIAYLSSVASKPPSYQAMEQLAGSVAKWFNDKSPDRESSSAPVAAAYLLAAAVQLNNVASPGEAVRLEAARTKAQYEIVGAVGVCAALCKDQQGAISSSGILSVLGGMILHAQSQQENQLSVVGVEFLQCALLAEQFQYAARFVEGTWPRPDATVNVKQVLRYYYLRGMIHLGCNDYVMAHRCFWTCLSVPAEIVCKIAIDAWKKLVLVQCVMTVNEGLGKDANKMTLPKSMPTCIGRLLASSADASTFNVSAGGRARGSQPSGLSMLGPLQQTEKTLDRTKVPVDAESTACYMDISAAFYTRDKAKLESLITEHQATLEGDGNFGLVQKCLTRLVHNQVRHLSKMYAVVPLSKLAALLGISSGEAMQQQVASLLIQSAVPCEIHETGMIEFVEAADETTTEAESLVELADWIGLLETVQRLDVDFWTSPRYQSLIKMDTSSANAAGDAKPVAADSGPRGVDDL